ncbi:hypothetical protein ACHAWF_007207 [Thalassiosira exigua]
MTLKARLAAALLLLNHAASASKSGSGSSVQLIPVHLSSGHLRGSRDNPFSDNHINTGGAQDADGTKNVQSLPSRRSAEVHRPQRDNPFSDDHAKADGGNGARDADGADNTQSLQSRRSAEAHQHRQESMSMQKEDAYIISSQPLAFQITMSIVLGLVAFAQLALLGAFAHFRKKRVLEFAQPVYICVLLAAGASATLACHLFLWTFDVGCALRDPMIFLSLSAMGATIAGRAWRISALMSSPLFASAGAVAARSPSSSSGRASAAARVEGWRQFVLTALSALSGCDFSALSAFGASRRGGLAGSAASASSGGSPLRVTITFGQMMRAIVLLCVPQIATQALVLFAPALRSTKALRISYHSGMTMGCYACQSRAAGSWPIYFGVLFAAFPLAVAYLLNLRPKAELEKLPQIIDERHQLNMTFAIFAIVLVVTLPVIGMTHQYHAPAIRTYASICVVMGLSLALTYQIGFVKLASLKSTRVQRRSGTATTYTFNESGGGDGRSSAAYAVKMAEMYSKIGRKEETLELIDETLDVWKKGNGGILGNQEGRDEVAAGFTRSDLNALEPEECEMATHRQRRYLDEYTWS